MRSGPSRRTATPLLFAAALALMLAACRGDPAPGPDVAATPVEAVTRLVADLRRNDPAGFARHSVPPALHRQAVTAWAEGRSTWPVSSLPLDDHLPALITTLAAPQSEKTLLASYNRQFAGAHRELRTAAATLGLFATQYIASAEHYSVEQRSHYTQMVGALAEWGRSAPLGDAALAREALPQLVGAARTSGLAGPDALRRTGMERSLERLGPFMERSKQVLAMYGLDVDAALDSMRVGLVEQTEDRARVRLEYELAGRTVRAIVLMERRDGQWYPARTLERLEAELGTAADPLQPA